MRIDLVPSRADDAGSGHEPTRRHRRRGRLTAAVLGVTAVAAALSACQLPPGALNGTARTASGTGVAGVPVAIYADDAETVVTTTTTDDHGAWFVAPEALDAGTYRVRVGDRWWPDADDWSSAGSVTTSAEEPATVDVTVPHLATLTGTAVDAAGAPVDDVLVLARRGGSTVGSTRSGPDGRYTLDLATPGPVTVMLIRLAPSTSLVVLGGATPTTFDPGSGTEPIGRHVVTTGVALPFAPSGSPSTIDVDYGASCAIRAGGTVWCWGARYDVGSPADAPLDNNPVPFEVDGITDAVAVGLGRGHACALRDDNTVWCWGDGWDGAFANGSTAKSPSAVRIEGIDDAIAIGVADYLNCAVRSTGSVVCWRKNHDALYLGFEPTAPGSHLYRVPGIDDATAVATGGPHLGCVRRSDATVWCWGLNYHGQFGVAPDNPTFRGPTAVPGATDVADLEIQNGHTCIRRADRSARCWGYNSNGQTGNPTLWDWQPAQLSANVDAVAPGSHHTCSLADGTVSCRGRNAEGQLGNGGTANSIAPVPVAGLDDAVEVRSAFRHNCARRADGRVSCWGSNDFGELGNGTTDPSPVPVDVVFP